MAVTKRRRANYAFTPNKRAALWKAANAVGQWGVNRLRQAYRSRGPGSRSTTNRGTRSGTGVTFQHDTKTVYRRKPAPKRVIRKIRRFQKRVDSVLDRHAGTQTLVLSNGFNIQSAVNEQNFIGFTLYGVTGTNPSWNYDIASILNSVPDVSDTLPNYARRVHMRNAVLDVTLRNTGATLVEMDLYEWYCKKTCNVGNPDLLLGSSENQESQTILGRNELDMYDVGATPFQFPNVGRYLTIRKKSKAVISAGNAYTYQIRDPRNKWIPADRIIDTPNAHFGIPGWTQGVYVVIKGTPSNTSPGVYDRASVANITGSVTRNYSWRTVNRFARDASGYTGTN